MPLDPRRGMRVLGATRASALAAALWIAWFVLGAWPAVGSRAQAAGFAVAAAVALGLAWRRPIWPEGAEHRVLVLLPWLLVVNVFLGPCLGLPPRLSPFTIGPLLWTASFFAARFAPRGISRLDRARGPLVLAFSAAYLLWFGTGAVLRILAFNVDFWDLGSISQAMANLARGRGFVSNDLAGFADPRYGGHLEGLFALLCPFMRWRYGDMAMCLLQIAAVLGAAWFMGRALERWSGRPAGFWAGFLGMALHPALAFPLWLDFHGDVFSVLPLALMAWAWSRRRHRAFWWAWAGALACSESALVASCGFALMLLGAGSAEPGSRRRGAFLFALSAGLFAMIVFAFMPLFKSPGAPTVAGTSLAAAQAALRSGWAAGGARAALAALLRHAFSLTNAGDLAKALAAFPAAALASPFLWLGALPGLCKDLLCGFDISTHHFAPTVPALFAAAGLAARRLPEGARSRALAGAVACALLAACLWGPTPASPQGRAAMASWRKGARQTGDKLARVRAALDPDRNRIVTGGLAGVAFAAPRLAFLGTTAREAVLPLPDADLVLELWDQGFTAWSPFGRMQDQLRPLLGGGPFRLIASGVLCRPCGGTDGGGLVAAAAMPDAPLDARLLPFPESGGPLGHERCQALVALTDDGTAIPLGIRAARREWSWFAVRVPAPGRSLRAQLRETAECGEFTAPIRAWRVIAQAP